MICKVHEPSKDIKNVLLYSFKKVTANKADVVMTCGIKDKTFEEAMLTFKPYVRANIRTEKPVFHASINPSQKLPEDEVKQIAVEYMRRMGYEGQPFVLFRHRDIDREHYHIVSYRTGLHGKKVCNDYREQKRSTQIGRELGKIYEKNEVEKAVPCVGRFAHEDGHVARQIVELVGLALDYNVQDFAAFKTVLSSVGVKVEMIEAFEDAVHSQSLSLQGLDLENVPCTPIMKASDLNLSYQDISQRLIDNKRKNTYGYLQKMRGLLRFGIKRAKSFRHFENILRKKGISVLYNKNEDGRIYGVTFINHRDKMIFKGSELGKDYSANVFEELRNGAWEVSENEKTFKYLPERHEVQNNNYMCQAFENWFADLGDTDYHKDMATNKGKKKRKRKKML